MAVGFFTGDNTPDSYEARERKRRLAEAMMLESTSTAPIGSWTQGAARLAQALSGKVQESRINAKDKEAGESYNKLAMSLLGGGSPSPAPSTSVNSAPSPLAAAVGGSPAPAAGSAANMPGDMSTWAAAIKKKESAGSGDYAAVGPTHPKLGRALGAYQVMEANIGPWSREALGREVTPDEFMKNPQIQDQIFQHKFGQYVQKFGNPQDAASAWFTGRPLAQGAGARDVLGTTGAAYVQDFNRNIGQQPVQMAQAPGPVASDAPPMAYAGAPAGQAISGASPQPQARPPGQQLAQAVAPTSPPIPQPQPTGNVNAAMYQIMSDPRFSPQQKAQALQMFQMQQSQGQVKPVDMGNQIAFVDARGNVVRTIPKQKDADFGVIGQDQFGTNQYGFIDKSNNRVTPVSPGAQAGGGQPEVTTADGRKIAVPEGMDPKEFRKSVTTEGAKTLVAAPDALRKAQEGIALIRATKNHPGLNWGTGATSVFPDLPGTDRRGFAAYHDQLKGQAFLQAFESLKGGGAITQIEGEKATQAIARLDRAQKPEDYKKALNDLEQIMSGAVSRLQKLPGMRPVEQPPADQPPEGQPAQRRRFNPATGRIE